MKLPPIGSGKPKDEYLSFVKGVNKMINRGGTVNFKDFSKKLSLLSDTFEKQNSKDYFTIVFQGFAERLVGMKQTSLAGIVYSFLIKHNQGKPEISEKIAQNALALAKKTNDPIHIMARTHDLRKIYQNMEYGSAKHLKMLRDERKALKTIVEHYEHSSKNFKTLTREVKPKEVYEEMLASVQVKIAKLIQKDSPKDAIQSFENARSIYLSLGNNSEVDFVAKEIENLTKLLQSK